LALVSAYTVWTGVISSYSFASSRPTAQGNHDELHSEMMELQAGFSTNETA
jgi:hypothetical protein